MAFCLLLSSRKQPGHSLQRRARAHPAARARMRGAGAAGGSSRSVPPLRTDGVAPSLPLAVHWCTLEYMSSEPRLCDR